MQLPPEPQENTRTDEHTRQCVRLINKYWKERGYTVSARREKGEIVSLTQGGLPIACLDAKTKGRRTGIEELYKLRRK